jgi:hypothetical protein|nr:MAG TPA: hypothetical protein [Caudoviricetes sp.]
MSCTVNRNSDNQITKVLDQQGNESKLFISVASNPLVENTETALEIYKNIYSPKISQENENNIQFIHEVNGKQFSSLKSALKEAVDGQKIELGFLVNNEFTPVMSVTKNVDKSSVNGFTQASILEGTMAENRVKIGNEYLLQSEGQTDYKKEASMDILSVSANEQLGANSAEISANTIKLTKTKGMVNLYDKSGQVVAIDNKDIEGLSLDQLRNKFENADEIFAEKEFKNNTFNYREKDYNLEQPIKTEEDIKLSLLKLLKNMGVTVTSVTNYLENYQIKNSVPASAEALADIANKVIAVQVGADSIENLTEETLHFIFEALPQERLENILRNIDKSEEYKQFAQTYREIYSREYNETDTETIVRKEILGKIALNALQQQAPVSESTQNFFDSAIQFIREFFQDIQAYFKPQYVQELDLLLNDVENLIQNGDVTGLQTENFNDSKFRFYNATPNNSVEGKLFKATNTLLQQLQQQEKSLRGTTIKNPTNTAKLERIQAEMGETIEHNSVAGLTLVAKTRVNEIKAAIKDSKQKNNKVLLSNEETIVFTSLVKDIQPILSALRNIIQNSGKKGNIWREQEKSLEDVILDISDISAEINTIDTQNVERLVNELTELHGISNPDSIKRWITTVEKDSNILLSTFGTMNAARDGMLNLMSNTLKNMTNEGFNEYMQKSKNLQTIIAQNGFTEADFAKFVDGGFILSPYDFNKFREKQNQIFLETYRAYSNSTLSDQELLDQRRVKELEPLGDRQYEYERELKKKEEALRERAYKDEYYTEYEKKLTDANVSKLTKDYLSAYFSSLADIKLKSIRTAIVNGKEELITDQTQLNAADRERLKEIQQDRRLVKSYYSTNGSLKDGIRIAQENGVNKLDEKGRLTYELLEGASSDAIVAYELNKLDSLNTYSGDNAEGIPQKFLNELRNVEELYGREEALDFLQMNSYTGFTSEFWEGLSIGDSVTAKLRRALQEDPSNASEIRNIIDEIETKNASIKNVIRLFSNKNSPVEIDADRMSSESKDRVKSLQEDISTLMQQARKYTKTVSDLDVDSVNEGEQAISSANDSYIKTLIDLEANFTEDMIPLEMLIQLEKQLRFAKEHMTNSNADAVTVGKISVDEYRRGNKKGVSKSIQRELEKQGLNTEDLLDSKIYATFIAKFAESRLLPYYKRFSPVSYNQYKEDLQTVENLTDFISDLSQYPSLQITPNPSFFEVEDNDNINPNYDRNFKGGYVQPNRRDFRNEKFFELFGDENGTRNPKLFAVYQAMMNYRMDSLEANSAGRGYNGYLLPQTRKGRVEKISNYFKDNPVQNTKNALQDIFNFTEDEQVKGDVSFGNTVKIIPKMYLAEVEPTDVSTELFYSLMLSGKESYARKSKVKHYGDIMSVMDTMKGRDYSATGKQADATQTMKMVRSAVDYSMFGIKEMSTAPVKTPFGTIDMAKTARVLLSYVKLKNLGGFNLVIPFTSWASAKLNVWTETLVGQYLHQRSHKLGSAEYGRKWKDGMEELGKINTKAEINVLGQHFRSFDLSESFESSNYGIFARSLNRSGMALHGMANYPIYGQNMYSVLYDYRVSDGRVINFNQFRAQQAELGLSKKEINSNWDLLEDQVLYKFITVKDGILNYDGKVDGKGIGEFINKNGEELTEELNKINNVVTNQIRVINSFVDGAISDDDRTYAQRDAYMSYLMTHKGWLSIATARRFKSRHFNFETGIEEEGSYQSAWNFLGDYIREYKDSGISGFITNFKKAYEKSDDTQRSNLIRVSKELAVLNAFVLLVMILKNFADDDDNKDLYPLQLVTYLAYRVANETTSSSLGIGANYTEALKAPIVGFDTVSNLTNVFKLFDGDEVTRGKYQGMSERAKFIISTVPGFKQPLDLYNINATRGTYENFNEKNLDFTVGASILWSENEQNE